MTTLKETSLSQYERDLLAEALLTEAKKILNYRCSQDTVNYIYNQVVPALKLLTRAIEVQK